MSDDLVAFLRARLDEDEVAAKACQSPAPWKAATDESDTWIVVDTTGEPVIYDEGTPSLEEAAHIALHDPDRVLREVQAGRALLASLQEHEECLDRGYTDLARGGQLALLTEMRRRAAVYNDHPDYRQEWKPDQVQVDV